MTRRFVVACDNPHEHIRPLTARKIGKRPLIDSIAGCYRGCGSSCGRR